ncbi:MAG TPA: class I SAM-dependent methyltransferase, partial [bacterium]
KLKSLFIKYKLHVVFEPLANFFLLLCYLSRLSRWLNQAEKPKYNDFYSRKHNYDKRYELYQYVVESEKLDEIYYMEFGVSQGHSFKWWVEQIKNKNSKFVGFDTFVGLPENWGIFEKSVMSVDGEFPQINDNRCEFVTGLFQNTLPDFLKRYNSQMRKVIHLDADIYSATLFVLTTVAPFLKKDDILFFDEFTVPLHEFKAYLDFINSYYIKTEIIGAVNSYFQIAFKITDNLSS